MLLLRSKKYARYLAYSSDVGEAVRPVVSNKVVAAASRSAGRVQHRKRYRSARKTPEILLKRPKRHRRHVHFSSLQGVLRCVSAERREGGRDAERRVVRAGRTFSRGHSGVDSWANARAVKSDTSKRLLAHHSRFGHLSSKVVVFTAVAEDAASNSPPRQRSLRLQLPARYGMTFAYCSGAVFVAGRAAYKEGKRQAELVDVVPRTARLQEESSPGVGPDGKARPKTTPDTP